jgi:hypothetical protein
MSGPGRMAAWLLLWGFAWGFCGSLAAGEIWLEIDTSARALSVMDGDRAIRVIENISVGRNGVSTDRTGRKPAIPTEAGTAAWR